MPRVTKQQRIDDLQSELSLRTIKGRHLERQVAAAGEEVAHLHRRIAKLTDRLRKYENPYEETPLFVETDGLIRAVDPVPVPAVSGWLRRLLGMSVSR